MNNVVVMMERNRRNNLTANFSVTKDQCINISAQISSWNLHATENAFFRQGKGLEKNYDLTGIGIWAKTSVGITGLRENFVRDGGIEEPYWGPFIKRGNIIIIFLFFYPTSDPHLNT